MSTVLNKLKRRRSFPVILPTGDQITIRASTFGELTRVGKINDVASKVGFVLGVAILDDDGTNLFKQESGESDEQFGLRVVNECELDIESVAVIRDELNKINTPPRQEVLQGNSEETSTRS